MLSYKVVRVVTVVIQQYSSYTVVSYTVVRVVTVVRDFKNVSSLSVNCL